MNWTVLDKTSNETVLGNWEVSGPSMTNWLPVESSAGKKVNDLWADERLRFRKPSNRWVSTSTRQPTYEDSYNGFLIVRNYGGGIEFRSVNNGVLDATVYPAFLPAKYDLQDSPFKLGCSNIKPLKNGDVQVTERNGNTHVMASQEFDRLIKARIEVMK